MENCNCVIRRNMAKIDIDEMYEGLRNAETGSEKNGYIRTKSRPKNDISTAFGPVQITRALAEGSNKNGYLKNSKGFYEKELKPRYDRMYKADDKDTRYTYGGDAEFDSAKHGQDYEMFAKEVMTGIADEAKHNEDEFIKKWRGRDKSQDPKYYDKVSKGRKSFKDKMAGYDTDIANEMVRQLE
jgi:hypothetical protein